MGNRDGDVTASWMLRERIIRLFAKFFLALTTLGGRGVSVGGIGPPPPYHHPIAAACR